jgi:hypothetical protein
MRTVDQSQFSAIRSAMVENEFVTKEVSTSAIKLTDKSFFKGQIEVGGQPVSVSPGFFMKLASAMKMSASLTREFIKNEDGKVAAALMNALNDYRQKQGGSSLLLIANASTRQVVDVCDPKRYRRLTTESLFDVTEKIMNEHSSLIVETVDANPLSGSISINLLNSNEIGFPGAGNDEFFKFGFSITQTTRDTVIETYNTRLVCSNGLRVSFGSGVIGGNRDLHFEEKFRLNGTGAEDIRTFLNRIDAMKKADFVPAGFQQSLTSAISTKASLAEVENAMMLTQRKVREDDPQFKKNFIDAVERNYFGGYSDAMARIVRKGQDPFKLNDKQKSFIKTSQSIWDVVNSLTFLGSNNSGIEIDNKHELKATAGTLFAKGVNAGYDLQFAQYAQL